MKSYFSIPAEWRGVGPNPAAQSHSQGASSVSCLVLEPLPASAWSRQAANSPGSSATRRAWGLLQVGYDLVLWPLKQLQHWARVSTLLASQWGSACPHWAEFAARSKAKAQRGRGDAPLQGCCLAVCCITSKRIPRGFWKSLKLPRRACLRAILWY